MQNTVEEIRAALTDFVCRCFMVLEAEFDKDRSLIDQGVIDSFGLVEITTFIEQRFGVTVREEDMTREAFGSLNKMARFVAARLEGSK
jgi:acyl carrier protein